MLSKISRSAKVDGAERVRRKKVAEFFKMRRGFFSKKDRLSGEVYQGRVVDPFQVFGDAYPVSSLNLVGDNWFDEDDPRPVALLWGFNNWKLGFVSDYLRNYRTAFAPRKLLAIASVAAFRRFPVAPSVFIFWGYTEPWLVRRYAQFCGIPIYRMEDGFLRSANLGASHSTPYSLILDSRGIHYDPSRDSDLQQLLNHHEFSEQELAEARSCLMLLRKFDLSKYNPPSFEEASGAKIKVRRRVGVVGQVDNDKSVQLGNVAKWSIKELIQLAKMENPDADVYYRPHPDVYKGYQRSRFRARSVQDICTIVNPDVPVTEFLDSVDHVYTITSLTGLEAVIRGLKVTVVGAAFYAGWGLTDDRVSMPRRQRKRTLEELFAAVYLKYPKYLGNLENSTLGFNSACLAIKADHEIEKYRAIDALNDYSDNVLNDIAATKHWPQVFFQKKSSDLDKKIIAKADLGTLFSGRPGRFFQLAFCYSICGQCDSNDARELFLITVRKYVEPRLFGELLLDLSRSHPGLYVAKQYAWLLSSLRNPDASLEVLAAELNANVRRHQAQLQRRDEVREEGQESEDPLLKDKEESSTNVSTAEQAELQLEIFEYRILMRDIDGAVEIAKKMLLEGYYISKLLPRIAELAEIRFDDQSARAVARFAYFQNLNSSMAAAEARAYDPDDALRDPWGYLALLAKIVILKPSMIAFSLAMLKRFEDELDTETFERLLVGVLKLNGSRSIEMAQALVAIEQPLPAVKMMEDLIDSGEGSPNTRITYSQTLSYAGRLDDAIGIMSSIRKSLKTSPVYRESLRLFILAGDYTSALSLVEDAIERRIEIGDMLPRKIYFGARLPEKAFRTFTEQRLTKTVQTYYRDKYLHVADVDDTQSSLLLVSIFGPGDEIRFASIYNLLPGLLPNKSLSITCDPRLRTIFERSFQHIEFLGVPRPRNSDRIDPSDYTRVPGSDISYVINNVAADKIDEADRMMVLTDMLHKCLPSYDAFPGSAYLAVNADLEERFYEKLPKGKILVGLSWRSSITTHSRNEHYLSVEELEPIFSVEGVQFVNLQYDDCAAELAWIESRYPGKIVDFPEVDQFNDFESVAAIMKSMDLVIAPATTVVELAGALGSPTWLLSNSSELHWRKIDSAGTDVWHRSISHVEGSILGDKASLVAELKLRLEHYVSNAGMTSKIA